MVSALILLYFLVISFSSRTERLKSGLWRFFVPFLFGCFLALQRCLHLDTIFWSCYVVIIWICIRIWNMLFIFVAWQMALSKAWIKQTCLEDNPKWQRKSNTKGIHNGKKVPQRKMICALVFRFFNNSSTPIQCTFHVMFPIHRPQIEYRLRKQARTKSAKLCPTKIIKFNLNKI